MIAGKIMKEKLRKNISKYILLSEQEFDRYYNLLDFKTVNKRDHLLTIGNICNNAFFIYEGCIRYYNIIDGNEHTGQFFFEESWYSDYESFLFERPSVQGIQALEKTTVAILSKKSLEILYDEIPQFERFGRLMAENAFMGLRKKTESLTHLTGEQRYAELLRTRPKVIKRVAQHYIASYLGIRPQSLSRIRNNSSKTKIS